MRPSTYVRAALACAAVGVGALAVTATPEPSGHYELGSSIGARPRPTTTNTTTTTTTTTTGKPQPTVAPAEDDPAFNCRVDGNHICGTDRSVTFWMPDGATFTTDPTTAARLLVDMGETPGLVYQPNP